MQHNIQRSILQPWRRLSALKIATLSLILAGCDGATITIDPNQPNATATNGQNSSNIVIATSSSTAYATSSAGNYFSSNEHFSSNGYFSSNDDGTSSYGYSSVPYSHSSIPYNYSSTPFNNYSSDYSYNSSSYDYFSSSSAGQKLTPQLAYEQNCEVCHGDNGQNGIAPINPNRFNLVALTTFIEDNMALLSPENCVGECAELTALHISSWTNREQRGKEIYAKQCTVCHGDYGTGAIFDLDATHIGTRDLIGFIEHNMPYYQPQNCTGSCAEDVGAYIKSWTVNGDIQRGQQLYREQKCDVCHGSNGQGPIATINANSWQLHDLVEFINDQMPYSEPWRCTGACAQDIAAFIKTWQQPVTSSSSSVITHSSVSSSASSQKDDELIALGKLNYRTKNCLLCHGDEGQGGAFGSTLNVLLYGPGRFAPLITNAHNNDFFVNGCDIECSYSIASYLFDTQQSYSSSSIAVVSSSSSSLSIPTSSFGIISSSSSSLPLSVQQAINVDWDFTVDNVLVDPIRNRAFITAQNNDFALHVVDLTTGELITDIYFDRRNPRKMALSPDNTTLYVTHTFRYQDNDDGYNLYGAVSELDLDTLDVLATHDLDVDPYSIAAASNYFVVATAGENARINVYQQHTGERMDSMPYANRATVFYDSHTQKVLITTQGTIASVTLHNGRFNNDLNQVETRPYANNEGWLNSLTHELIMPNGYAYSALNLQTTNFAADNYRLKLLDVAIDPLTRRALTVQSYVGPSEAGGEVITSNLKLGTGTSLDVNAQKVMATQQGLYAYYANPTTGSQTLYQFYPLPAARPNLPTTSEAMLGRDGAAYLSFNTKDYATEWDKLTVTFTLIKENAINTAMDFWVEGYCDVNCGTTSGYYFTVDKNTQSLRVTLRLSPYFPTLANHFKISSNNAEFGSFKVTKVTWANNLNEDCWPAETGGEQMRPEFITVDAIEVIGSINPPTISPAMPTPNMIYGAIGMNDTYMPSPSNTLTAEITYHTEHVQLQPLMDTPTLCAYH